MIHNNFRKILKKLLGYGYATGNDLVRDYTDIYGYTGSVASGDIVREIFSANVFNKTFSNVDLDTIINNKSSTYITCFAVIGNSTENEQDYTLGELISNNVRISTANVKESATFSTTITNVGGTAISFDEVALMYHYFASNYWHNPANTAVNLLLIKEKLSEPLTLGAGDSISISFNMFGDVTISEA